MALSTQILEQQQQPSKDRSVAGHGYPAVDALHRIRLCPETVIDRSRRDREQDQTCRAKRGMPSNQQQRAPGEQQHRSKPERESGEGHTKRCHARDVLPGLH